MSATVERTRPDRMTDMYVVRMPGISKIASRFLSFRRAEWEEMYPHLKLNRGEIRKIYLTFDEIGV